jgi:DNA processing protein
VAHVQVQTVTPHRLAEARRVLGTLPASLELRGVLPEAPLCVAIVGARAAGASDLALAGALAAAVVQRGGVVVSGGALGIDGAAHRAALGATFAVLGTGLDVVYPWRHRALFARIPLVSQFPRDAQPLPWRFVVRNQVIAALADRVIVVGASERSGALHTAAAAVRLGRGLAASPGADGCDQLLAGGAARVASVADLDAWLDGAALPAPRLAPPESEDGRRVLEACADHALAIDQIAARAGTSLRITLRTLAQLEADGLVRAAPGQTYRRSPLARVTA